MCTMPIDGDTNAKATAQINTSFHFTFSVIRVLNSVPTTVSQRRVPIARCIGRGNGIDSQGSKHDSRFRHPRSVK